MLFQNLKLVKSAESNAAESSQHHQVQTTSMHSWKEH